MAKVLNPVLAGALAAALAGTTGYCVVTKSPDPPPPHPAVTVPPARLLPEAVEPYPLLPHGTADGSG